MKINSVLTLLMLAGGPVLALNFTQAPAMVKEVGNAWKITFAVNEFTDVEISVVDAATGAIVRHLAAGVLGVNAPSPLAKNSLSQTVFWDGLDDARGLAAAPGNLTVRVRAGMSVRLDKVAGGDPYEYSPIDPGGTIFGITRGENGSIFLMYRPHGVTSIVMRQYSATGDYIKTLFPIPGDRPASSYTGWGLNMLTSTAYSPVALDFYGPLQSNSPLGNFARPAFVPTGAGQLGLLDDLHNRVWSFREDGSRDAAMAAVSQAVVSSPAIPSSIMNGSTGALFFTVSPDRSSFLMSGVYNPADGDTGFWRDGRLFKVDMTTRTATVFFDLDSVLPAGSYSSVLSSSYLSELHGSAMDDSGHVFLCDRLNGRILVLSSAGQIIKSFAAKSPDDISYNRSTGVVYATCRDKVDGLYLVKIADWRNNSTVTSRMLVKKSDGIYGNFGYCDNGIGNRTFLTNTPSAQGTLIWLAYRIGGISLYQEAGDSFSLYKNFRTIARQQFTGLKRLVVDPATETPYITATGSKVYKVADWNNPVFQPCSTQAANGARAALTGADLALDPLRRQLFVRQSSGSPNNGDIVRFSIGPNYLTPAPLSRMATNAVVTGYQVPGTTSLGSADYGFAVAPNGHMASMSQQGSSLAPEALRYYPVYHTQSAYNPLMLLSNLVGGSKSPGGGVRFDLKGNLYAGLRPAGSTAGLPSIIFSDRSWTQTLGTIHRFNARGSLSGDLFTSSVSGPDKIYNVDYGPFGNTAYNASTCACMTASFGMDGWGRIYTPNGVFQKITVVDNEGNGIARFGNYGNMDNVAEELAGVAGTAGKCYMAYPFCVDASDHYIYSTDPGNVSLLRFKKVFALDNIPSMNTAREAVRTGALFALTVSPNPAIAEALIRLQWRENGGTALRVAVYDISGRLVRRIASGQGSKAGMSVVRWDGRDGLGRGMASGLYVVRAEGSQFRAEKKFTLAR